MKLLLILTFAISIASAFTAYDLILNMGTIATHGELFDTNTSSTLNDSKQLQHNVKKLDRKPW